MGDKRRKQQQKGRVESQERAPQMPQVNKGWNIKLHRDLLCIAI